MSSTPGLSSDALLNGKHCIYYISAEADQWARSLRRPKKVSVCVIIRTGAVDEEGSCVVLEIECVTGREAKIMGGDTCMTDRRVRVGVCEEGLRACRRTIDRRPCVLVFVRSPEKGRLPIKEDVSRDAEGRCA